MKWMDAVNKFLDMYKDKEYFLGAILTGSYASGNQKKSSDIDIYIIAKNNISWRERGSKNVDGFLIDYFIDPIVKIENYLENESKTFKIITTRAFAFGKILVDKDGSVKVLVDKAQSILENDFKKLDSYTYNMNCYKVWDYFNELETKYKEKKDIDFSYYLFIEKLIDGYFQNNQIGSISLNKLEYILNNSDFKTRYEIKDFPNKDFTSLLSNCLKAKDYDKKYESAKKIYDYFMCEFCDFDINNFSSVDTFDN